MKEEQALKAALDRRFDLFVEQMEAEGQDGVLLTSRQNSRYMAGFTGSTSVILLTRTSKIIFVDSRYTEQAKEQCLGFDVREVPGLFQAAVRAIRELDVKRLGLEEQDITWANLRSLERLLIDMDVELLTASNIFTKLRVVKDDLELNAIKEAVRIADLAWERTLPEIKVGVTEAYVAAYLEHQMRLLGAEGPSFETIIASGYRSAMPHGVASDKVIEYGDTIVMDFGAVYQGYCSDMTRTVFVGAVDPKMEEVYKIVLEANLACERDLKAGLSGVEGDMLSRKVIDDAGYGAHFTHSTGHSLGLDIHESPRLSQLFSEKLPENCLMTIEPGIYLAGLGGVRIEDVVIIKADGIEILTQSDKSLRVL